MVPSRQTQDHFSVTASSVPPETDGSARKGMSIGEMAFLLLTILALIGVVLSGRFAYREAVLLQQAKENGLLLLHWARAVAAASEGRSGLPHDLCQATKASVETPDALQTVTWARCREQLWGEHGPLAGRGNPFGTKAPVLATSCEKGYYLGRGAIVLEKGTGSPPGFPASTSYTALGDDEALVKGLMLRILVCDPSGYGVRVGEVKL